MRFTSLLPSSPQSKAELRRKALCSGAVASLTRHFFTNQGVCVRGMHSPDTLSDVQPSLFRKNLAPPFQQSDIQMRGNRRETTALTLFPPGESTPEEKSPFQGEETSVGRADKPRKDAEGNRLRERARGKPVSTPEVEALLCAQMEPVLGMTQPRSPPRRPAREIKLPAGSEIGGSPGKVPRISPT